MYLPVATHEFAGSAVNIGVAGFKCLIINSNNKSVLILLKCVDNGLRHV